MKFSKISGWLLLVILSICISACSSDSDKEDSPTPPAGDSSEIIGYWHSIDYANEESIFEFKDNNIMKYCFLGDKGIEYTNGYYYLDDNTGSILVWFESDDYEVYEIRSIRESSFDIALYNCEIELWDEFGYWYKFDVKKAKECIDFVARNHFSRDKTLHMTRFSKKDFDDWIKNNE